jgi:hypothetical protein
MFNFISLLNTLSYLLSFLIVNLIVVALELCAIQVTCIILSLNYLFLWCLGTIEIYPTLRYRTETVTPAAVNGLGKRIFCLCILFLTIWECDTNNGTI